MKELQKKNKKSAVEKIMEISNKIIEENNLIKKEKGYDDIEMYKIKIKLSTYSNYLPQLLYDFISFFDKKFILASDFSIEKFYPEIYTLYNEITGFLSGIECKDYLNENRKKLNYFYITKGEIEK